MIFNELRNFMHWVLRPRLEVMSARILLDNERKGLVGDDVTTEARHVLAVERAGNRKVDSNVVVDRLLERSREEPDEKAAAAQRLVAGYLLLQRAIKEGRKVDSALVSAYERIFPEE